MIIGVPNVGKSSLINMLRSTYMHVRHALPVGAVAGVTRSLMTKMKINNNPKIFMFDTPGRVVIKIKLWLINLIYKYSLLNNYLDFIKMLVIF